MCFQCMNYSYNCKVMEVTELPYNFNYIHVKLITLWITIIYP